METVSAGEARENLFSLVEQVNQDHLPRVITSQKGDAVLLSKEDWDSLQETIYLQSVPGLVDSVRVGAIAPRRKLSFTLLISGRRALIPL